MEPPNATTTTPNITTTTEETMNTTRHEPLLKYRITISHGNGTGETLYCDDRDEAIALANERGGRAEAYVYGIGWESISKVKP